MEGTNQPCWHLPAWLDTPAPPPLYNYNNCTSYCQLTSSHQQVLGTSTPSALSILACSCPRQETKPTVEEAIKVLSAHAHTLFVSPLRPRTGPLWSLRRSLIRRNLLERMLVSGQWSMACISSNKSKFASSELWTLRSSLLRHPSSFKSKSDSALLYRCSALRCPR